MKLVIGSGDYYWDFVTILKITVFGLITVIFFNEFIGIGILMAQVMELLGVGIIPQPGHFHLTVAFPLIVIAGIIAIRKVLKYNTRIPYIAILIILLTGLVESINNGLSSQVVSGSMDEKISAELYSQQEQEVYTSFFLINSPEEIMDNLRLKEKDLSDCDVQRYVYHADFESLRIRGIEICP